MLLTLGQRMLNEQIAASTAARERLAEVDGKRFAVVVKGTSLRIVMAASNGELLLSASREMPSEVELTGGAIDLIRLARTASLAELKDIGCVLSGDIKVAEAFADLMRLAMPEPEAMLADWVGDIPAHALGEAARGAVGFGERARSALEQNLAEYLQEEQPTLVPPALARHLNREIDRVRDDVERAERRVERLERRLGGKS